MMRFIKANQSDFIAISQFYLTVIEKTKYMDKYGQWKKDVYPTDTIIQSYLTHQQMYLLIEDKVIIAAMAITMYQDDSYHHILWNVEAKDDEVAVIHLLGMHPYYQNKGIGARFLEKAIQLAKFHQKKVIRLDALESNMPARHLYEKMGFEYRGKQFLYAPNTGETYFYFYEKII